MNQAESGAPLREGQVAAFVAGTTTVLATVIASLPGIAEQSLRATLEALAGVKVVGTATGCLSAWQLVREHQAELVAIDSNLSMEEVQQFLRLLGQEARRTRSLVLVETTSQVYRALAAGADAALRRDASIRELGAAVAGLQRLVEEADAEAGDGHGNP